MPWPHTFAAESGDVSASQLDDNFDAAAFASDVTSLSATVAGLPSNATPKVPTAGGEPGVAATLSRDDHQHPPQAPEPNLQTGTSYSVTSANDGQALDISNAAAITATFTAANLQGYYSGTITQSGLGQITLTAGVGTTFRQASGYSKTRAQWSVVSWYVRTFGAGAVEIVLAGDMA